MSGQQAIHMAALPWLACDCLGLPVITLACLCLPWLVSGAERGKLADTTRMQRIGVLG
jgi:hypothetical protein